MSSVVAGLVPLRHENHTLSALPIHKGDLVQEHYAGDSILQRYEIVTELGRGTFGSVVLVEEDGTGVQHVCKIIDTQGMKSDVLATMKKEIDALQELDHPHIVRLFEHAHDLQAQNLYLVMEKIPGGDLNGLLESQGQLNEALVARLMHQVIAATAYCHSHGIVHRDIKPENIMLTGNNVSQDFDCKVIDFGLSARFEMMTQLLRNGDLAGTPAYIAPEIVLGVGYGPKADVWSIGVTAYQMLTGELPFGEPDDYDGDHTPVFDNIKAYDGQDPDSDVWHGRSEGACDFVAALMSKSPEDRPTAAEAYLDPWVDEQKFHDGGLTRSMLHSLNGYASAPRLTKVCLLLIAARMEGEDLKRFRHAFDRLDTDGSGVLDLSELEVALHKTSWCWDADVDVGSIFLAADLNKDDVLEYTEFIAACLHTDLHARTGKELAALAFQALDIDHDGFVTVDEVHQFFHCEKHLPLLEGLPNRAFSEQEFYRCLSRTDDGSNGISSQRSSGQCSNVAFPLCACRNEDDSEDEFTLSSVNHVSHDDQVTWP